VRKLINFGVPDILIRCIYSFLIDRQQRVKMCDAWFLQLGHAIWVNDPGI